ncbi:zinc finger BED domain-containing protein 4-like [Tachysurus ichikawai]
MTTDSGTNMIKALKLNEWTNLQCFGHNLHKAIDPKFRTAYIEINKIEKIKKRAITKLLPTEKRTSPPGSFVLLHQEEAQFELKKKKMLGSFFTKKVAPSPQSEADKIETEMTSWCFIHFI